MIELIQRLPNGKLTSLNRSLGYSQTYQNLILTIQKMTSIPEVKFVG